MKKKLLLFIVLNFCILTLCKIKVHAKIIVPDEIEDNSYVIGTYLYTRAPNADYNYDGALDTAKMLLASKTIDGGMDKMIVYYKNFLGNWINGSTGESIEPPAYFEIENRNLREIIPAPEMVCKWNTSESLRFANCSPGVYYNDNLIDSYSNDYGVEYYLLKTSSNGFTSNVAKYINGKFTANNEILTPVETDFSGGYDNNTFYQIVSRFYYEDTDINGNNIKVYSDYSNIVTNGMKNKLGLSQNIVLNPKITNIGMNIKNEIPYYDVTFYNVEFTLSNIDTSKYILDKYEVYVENTKGNPNFQDNYNAIANLTGSSKTYEYLYNDSLADEIYQTPHYLNLVEMWSGISKTYLTAEFDFKGSYDDTYDISNFKAYSKRFDKIDTDNSNFGTFRYIAKVWLCDRSNPNVCFTQYSLPSNAQVN